MDIIQTEKDALVLPLFVPPQGDVCFINSLPPELLCRIFETGATGYDHDEDEDIFEYWDNVRKLVHDTEDGDGDDEMTKELEDAGAEEGDDDETDDDDDDDDGDDDEADNSDVTGSSDFAPWPPFQVVVSHVCRHWRNLALSTPSLWTTIVVGAMRRPPYEAVSILLERSKGLPIDIYVDCEPEEHECDGGCAPSETDLRLLYQLLIPNIHRWRTIEISVTEYRQMFVFLTAVSDPSISSAPQLTTLQLYHHEEAEEFDNFGYPSMSQPLVLFGGSAPCLTNVALWGVHVDWDQPWIASNSKLTDLELAFHPEDVRPSWAQLVAILRSATSLQRLSLRMSGAYGDPPEWIIEPTPTSAVDLNSPVQLPNLTEFVFAFHSQTRAIGLLHKFVLPALRHLVLDFDNGDYTEFVHTLAGPATSSFSSHAGEKPRSLLSSLESLKIAGLPCRTECITVLYRELQNLKSLNLSLSFVDEEFLNLLYAPDILLPRLTTLFVSGTSGEVLRELVEHRKDAGVPLESLYMEESCDVEDEDVEWFEKNLKKFEIFEGSDDEDVVEFEESDGDIVDYAVFDDSEDVDAWSDMDY